MHCRGLRPALGSIVAVIVTLAASRTARADVEVERTSGADSCPDTESFASRMNEGAVHRAAVASSIAVRFERTATGYRSTVSTTDGTQRTLSDDASTCDGLAEATVLAVKLALDLAAPPPVPPARAIEPAPIGEWPTDDEAVTPRASAPRPAAVVPEISASGVLTFGITSPVAPGVRGGAALVLGKGRWSIGITGLVLPSKTHRVGEGEVDVSILGGGVEGCGRSRIAGRLLLALCARAEASRFAGTARGFPRAESHARPLFTGTLLGRVRVDVAGPVALFAEAGAVLPIVRERFSIDAVGVVYDPPVLGATTGIGASVDFE